MGAQLCIAGYNPVIKMNMCLISAFAAILKHA